MGKSLFIIYLSIKLILVVRAEYKCVSLMASYKNVFLGVSLVLMLVLSLIVHVPNDGSIVIESEDLIASASKRSPIVYTASTGTRSITIRNVSINGTLMIGSFSSVVIENVTFYGEASLIVEDNAFVDLSNFKINDSLVVYTLDSARLNMEYFGSGEFLTIYAYNYSNVSFSGNTSGATLYLYNNTALEMRGGFGSLNVYAEDSASIMIRDSTVDSISVRLEDRSVLTIMNSDDNSTSSSFTAYDSSILNIENSQLSESNVNLYSYSALSVEDSSLYSVEAWGFSTMFLYNVTANEIRSRGDAAFYIELSEINKLYTHIDTDLGLYMAHGYVYKSNVSNAYLYSPMVTTFNQSIINSLYYTVVHTGELQVNESGVYSTSSYKNYENVSSTINSITMNSDTLAYSASSVVYNVSDTLFLIDVEHADIYDADQIYTIDSELNILNLSRYSMSLFSMGSSIDIADVVVGYMVFDVSNSTLALDSADIGICYLRFYFSNVSINDSYLEEPSLYLYDSIAYSNNTVYNDTDFILVSDSEFYVSYSTINTTSTNQNILVMSGKFVIENSNISGIANSEFELENGVYFMNNGVVTNTGNIKSGIAVLGSSDMDDFVNKIDNIYVYDSELVFENYTLPPELASVTYIYLYNTSDLAIRETNTSIHVESYGESQVTVQNSEIMQVIGDVLRVDLYNASMEYVSCNELYGTIEDTTLNDIYTDQTDLKIIDSNISVVEVDLNAILEIENSNIEKVSIGSFEDMIFSNGSFGLAQILINQSVVGEVNVMGYGSVRIKDSSVDTLYYTFTGVTLENATLNFTIKNYLINASGEVVIDHNSLPSSAVGLLTADSDTSIGAYSDVIVFNRSDLSLVIRNSEYMAVLGTNGSLTLVDSELKVLLLFYANTVNVSNTYINATFTDEPPPIAIIGNHIYVSDVMIEGSGLLAGLADAVSISNLTTTMGVMFMNTTGIAEKVFVNAGWCYMFAANISLSDSNLGASTLTVYYSNSTLSNVTTAKLSIVNSSLIAGNVEVNQVEIIGSSIEATNANFSMMIIRSESLISLQDSNVSEVMVIPDNTYGSISYTYYPDDISLTASHSRFSSTFAYYDIISGYGELSDVPPLNSAYGMKTQYIDSEVDTIDTYIIDVEGYSLVDIVNFETSISMIRINTTPDETPPTISIANDTPIEYELGMREIVSFQVYDQTRSKLEVYLNDTNVLSDYYTGSKEYTINLSVVITNPGNYVLNILTEDAFGNTVEKNITIIVYPQEPPEIVLGPDANLSIYVGEEIALNWSARDKSPDTYTIYVDGNKVDSGSWISDQRITYSFSSNSTGTYNITIVFKDKIGLTTTKTTIITVKERPGGGISTTLLIAIIAAIIGVAVVAFLIFRYRRKKD